MTRPDLNRVAVIGLLGSTAVAGLLFAPVFGLPALLVPVLVVVLVGYGCVELAARWPRLAPFRPLLVVFLGLLGLIEAVLFPSTVAGLPTAASLRGIQLGFSEGWRLTLQSTLPARPDAEQLLFVPLAVLLATVLGVELLLLLRLRKPAVALLPGLVVAGLSQMYQALSGGSAFLAVACYAAPAALLLWAERPSRSRGHRRRLSNMDAWVAVPTVVAVTVGAVALGFLDPVGRDPYQLGDQQAAALRHNRINNPLQDVAHRLTQPDQEVFRYRGDGPVDRWSLAVLAGFDGANWSADVRLRRLGVGLDAAAGSTTRSADVRVRDLSGPWLPSQPKPLGVTGLTPLVDQSTGTLLLDQPTDQARAYRLTWSESTVDATALGVGSVDTQAVGGLGELGAVPADVDQLARNAVRGLRPTFQSALQLERFLGENYKIAQDKNLPTGNGWPQLRHFLLTSKVGTSEQFAAAYVLLARINGIPARLVVGFKGGTETDGGFHVVRNRDVLAWPEVAVAGVGWVPLDPTARAAAADPTTAQATGLAKATAQARKTLPAEQDLRPPQLPGQQQEDAADESTGAGTGVALIVTAGVLAVLLVGWLFGLPLAKAIRTRRRRRRAGTDAVIGAWDEVCDRLRAHGVPYRIGMTPRDLAESAAPVLGEQTAAPVLNLGQVLDMVLWSGVPVTNGAVRRAWNDVQLVSQGLAKLPFSARLRATMDPRTLLRPKDRSR
ncbi:DUF3488 and transglutaminase-like domain-containing protein [Actinocrispum wychmicini]|uniref:Uncharacterized protein DUF4129 n=1 Tax=Actinocrispum wychmicini TaxID=1213861 RepID=A0A4R2JEU5_9PSEU|nr:transglutaminaseTgpA domain-containing protein [Actinocrispum wychmicini]TCO54769.1 uncharacterized protein DUF4129 [Actinocrispum wychmicini]